MQGWIHTCSHPRCTAARSGRTAAGARVRNRSFTVDMHCHVLTPEVEAVVADRPEKKAEAEAAARTMGVASVAHNNAVMLPYAAPRLTRLEARLDDMEIMGIDLQVLSPTPTQYYYWADTALATDIVRMQNEHIAGLCASQPRRLAGFGTVALQHAELACAQLEYAVRELGLKGVEISTSVNGRELSDPQLRPFWSTAQRLGAVVFLHPFGTTLGDRTRTHYLVNTIGQPLETTIALSHLMFQGVLDAYPALKILAAHGGGYLPLCIGRSNHAHAVRPEAAADASSKPSDLLARVWFDTVVHDALALSQLIARVGASQVVVGTDYPFDMGHYCPHELVGALEGLTEADRVAILGGNAARLIGLSWFTLGCP